MGDVGVGAALSLLPLSCVVPPPPMLTALPLVDLSNLMTNLASLEQERDVLQQENEEQWEEMAWWV